MDQRSNPTRAARTRLDVASTLARACPTTIGTEVAVTGSVARGEADEDSDVEINLWGEEVPPREARVEWVATIEGAGPLSDDVNTGDGSVNATFVYRRIPIELTWQPTERVDRLLDAILSGEAGGHYQVAMASHLREAVSLRTVGWLAAWVRRLGVYPDVLRRRIIEDNTRVWQLPHAVEGRWTLVRRGQSLALTERLLWDVYNILRVLYAVNREWEPDWKWIRPASERLTLKPERLAGRLDAIFLGPDPRQRVIADQELIRDTLALAPDWPGIMRAREVVENSLRGGRFAMERANAAPKEESGNGRA